MRSARFEAGVYTFTDGIVVPAATGSSRDMGHQTRVVTTVSTSLPPSHVQLAVSDDAGTVAVPAGRSGAEICVWSVESETEPPTLAAELKGHTSAVSAMVFIGAGACGESCSFLARSKLRLFISSILFNSGPADRLVSASTEQEIFVWDLGDTVGCRRMADDGGEATKLHFEAHGLATYQVHPPFFIVVSRLCCLSVSNSWTKSGLP